MNWPRGPQRRSAEPTASDEDLRRVNQVRTQPKRSGRFLDEPGFAMVKRTARDAVDAGNDE